MNYPSLHNNTVITGFLKKSFSYPDCLKLLVKNSPKEFFEIILVLGEISRVSFCWDAAILTTSQQKGGIGGEVIRHTCFWFSSVCYRLTDWTKSINGANSPLISPAISKLFLTLSRVEYISIFFIYGR